VNKAVWFAVVSCAILVSSIARGQELDGTVKTQPRDLYLTGRYAEAAKAYEKLSVQRPIESAIGRAQCDVASGKYDSALAELKRAADEQKMDARVQAELARLYLARGNHDTAQTHVDAAIKLDKEQPLARWVQSELYLTSGRLKEAEAAYKWFVDYYNEKDEITDADTLRLVGLAAAQYARWNRLRDQYSFLVNELYPDILKLDKNYWPAHYEAGLLFLEKFNQADASKELNKALAINPNAAEVHAALAALALQNYDLVQAKQSLARAIELNGQLVWAKQLQADVHLSNFDAASAIETLGEAIKLNPRDEGTLGLLAAAYIARDGIDEQSVRNALSGESVRNALRGVPEAPNSVVKSTRPTERHGGRSLQNGSLAELIAEVNARNPHAGEFYNSLGNGLDRLRRYPTAERFYTEAIKRMPQLVAPYGQLGLIQMRLADEAAAEKTLAKAFQIDPFNVRVSNSIKVLEVLAGYATIETEHFVIKFDRGHDEVLARAAAKYLEDDVYPALCRRLGYEPKGKSLFEFFSRAKNTDGHGWFSARMVGLPYVGTVGACAGRVVAMQSPNDAREPFNWARVLRHEFVHVVNLQQTNFNIPHWFTEALAVYNEELQRPELWDRLLSEAAKEKKLFNLDTINGGFVRPKSSAEWNLAYCQAELYAEYMLARFGDDALAKMLAAYADNLTTPRAIERCFGVVVKDFEQGYEDRVAKIVAGIRGGKLDEERPLGELQKAHDEMPQDQDIAARLAAAYLVAANHEEARALADQVLKKQPRHQLAAYVLARLRLRAGETAAVIELLETSLDHDKPQANHLALLAGLKLKAEKHGEAAALYELGRQKYPGDQQWTQALARVYLLAGEDQKLAGVLAELAAADADGLPLRKKLAELAYQQKDWPQAGRWAREATQIDVNEARMHLIAAEAAAAAKKYDDAVHSFALATRLDPRSLPAREGLVRAYLATEQPAQARVELEALKMLAPDESLIKALAKELEELLAK
jgi:tetratricopeptide (TPR) repeat protein